MDELINCVPHHADAEARANLAAAQPRRFGVVALVHLVRLVAVRQPRATRRSDASRQPGVQLLQPERQPGAAASECWWEFV